tara:strand:- start:3599 stop:4294 length:696 start_codon:yes stop_codon:yes gene_type:complete
MSFNLEPINTGVTANDGQGDPLRTAFSKTFSNSRTLSGQLGETGHQIISGLGGMSLMGLQNQFDDLSGSLQVDYESGDNAVSGNLQTQITSLKTATGVLNSRAPVITNRRYNSLVNGETVRITGAVSSRIIDGHYNVTLQEIHFGTGTSFSSSPYSYLTGAGSHLISYPVTNIGSPYDTDKDYNLSTSGDNVLAITRTSDPKNVAVSGAGSTNTDLDGLSYHYLDVHLREY